MATTIKQSFSEYASNLQITDRQGSVVSTCRTNVANAIERVLSLHPERSKLIGSYDRNTLTRYLSEGDVDDMVILHYGDNSSWDTPEGTVRALDKFKSILEEKYPNTPMRRDENCITMQLSEFRLDVVPAFKLDSGRYKIPDSVQRHWIETDPFAFADLITQTNRAMDGTFIPLIKMVKGWNREKGWPIRSFHLECILYNRYKNYTEGYSYDSMLMLFFEALPSYLSSYCYDPITYEQVDAYLDNSAATTRRQIAINKANTAAVRAREAYDDQTTYSNSLSIAIGEWKALLGDFFPTYG
jgi:hypothetical protein